MKQFTVLGLLLAIQANAQWLKPIALKCIPSNPCEYVKSSQNERGSVCVKSIEINGRIGGDAVETIHYRHLNFTFNVAYVPDEHEVSVNLQKGLITFQDETGDQNGELQAVAGGKYKGTITVDQDFAYDVTCTDKAIGYERY